LNKVAFVFPGQGSQYKGMGKYHFDNNKVIQEIFDEASDLIGVNMKELCFETGIKELTQTKNTQIAIFITSYAAFHLFMKEGLEPSFMAGHSLGEITALTCSGAISFCDAIKLVRARGLIMQKIADQFLGSMIAVKGLNIEAVEELCREYSVNGKIAIVSNYNSVNQIVISGHEDIIMQVGEAIKENNCKYTQLKVSAPFHSPLMNSVIEEFRNELKKYTYHKIKYPVVSNVNARTYSSSDEIVEMLSKHLVRPVLWKNTVDFLRENEVKLVVELGPKDVLKNLVKNCTDKINAFSYDDINDRPKLMSLVDEYTGKSAHIVETQNMIKNLLKDFISQTEKLSQHKPMDFTELSNSSKKYKIKPTVVTLCLANAVCVPNKNFNELEYQNGVVEPYKKIRRMQANIEREEREPNPEEMEEAFQMLFSVFNTKKISIKEQEFRFKQICDRLVRLR